MNIVMSEKLQGKIAIITGGASGIGKGMAMAFVKEGATVAIIDLNEKVGKQSVQELQQYQPDSMFIQANLAEHDKLEGLVKQVAEKYGRLDILVNNAHASKNMPFEGYAGSARSFVRHRLLSDVLPDAGGTALFERIPR